MPHYDNVLYRTAGSIAYITLNRPTVLNALNQATLADLLAAFDAAAADAAVRGVILSGEGKAFAAGADIGELAAIGAVEAQRFTRYGQHVFDRIERLGKPVIAAVNGYAFGGGCELAMACTLRIASERAAFGQPEVKLGVLPGFGGTQRLPRLVGAGRALQLILSAATIDAEEARRIGLVNEVVPADGLIARAETILAQITANAPLAVRLATEAVLRGLDTTLADGLALEGALFAVCAASDDKREGTQAFLAKRAPRYAGR
ncbi:MULTISPECIES: enoyl-CoA hydratase-related protein [unclassified Duganella]|uniref:enoyl-CoA hydratase-related protein n=1 Tax=unclassified Duganella TaxID=2636909 RepID=UPI000E34539C|nr:MULTISPECIES: enoyl-CoA hydratase-related protein [unclassified Duganella]RFP15824.1 enoyl-CoA hydratase [Duganella sp. BJB475]RFP33011.1 enoyl-CoA hydratase [Duganella sp. BJB476]